VRHARHIHRRLFAHEIPPLPHHAATPAQPVTAEDVQTPQEVYAELKGGAHAAMCFVCPARCCMPVQGTGAEARTAPRCLAPLTRGPPAPVRSYFTCLKVSSSCACAWCPALPPSADGYDVDYLRVPVTDEKAPKDSDFEELIKRLWAVPDDAGVIFNCQVTAPAAGRSISCGWATVQGDRHLDTGGQAASWPLASWCTCARLLPGWLVSPACPSSEWAATAVGDPSTAAGPCAPPLKEPVASLIPCCCRWAAAAPPRA